MFRIGNKKGNSYILVVLNIITHTFLIFVSPRLSLAVSPGQEALDKGASYYRQGLYLEAMEKFKESTEKDPALLKAWENLGRAHMKLNRFSEAKDIFDTLLKLRGDDLKLLNSLGYDFHYQHESQVALSYWKRSLQYNSSQPKIIFAVGNVYEHLGDCQAATREYKKLFATNLFSEKSMKRASRCLVKLERINEAMGLLTNALQTFPTLNRELAILYGMEGKKYFAKNNFTQAQKLFTMSAKIAPREPKHLVDLGWTYRRTGDNQGAIDTWKAALRLDPSHKGLYQPLGDLYFDIGQLQEAEQWYTKGLKYSDIDVQTLRKLGWSYWKNEQWQACERVWELYLKASVKKAEPLSLLARLSMKAGDHAQAAVYAKQSLVLDSSQPNTALTRVQALLKTEDYTRAKDEIQNYLTQFPNHLGLNQFWGDLLMQYHDFDRGEAQWRKVLNLGGETDRAHVFWVRSLYERGQYKKALEYAHRILASHGPNKHIYTLFIDDAVSQGKLEQAILHRKTYLTHFPEDERMWIALSESYRKLNNNEEAAKMLAEAQKKLPLSTSIQIARAELNISDRKFDEALERFSALQKQFPNNRRVFNGLLLALKSLKQKEEVLAHLRGNRRFFLTKEQEELYRANILADSGKLESAKVIYKDIQQSNKQAIDIPILLYHGIGGHSRSSNISQAHFDQHLKALYDAGYSTITVKQLDEIVQGVRTSPKRPILITFDDARIDAFQLADNVLKRYGMNATMFVPTGLIVNGHPFFGDWDFINDYYKTGRWDLQSHGHDAHRPVVINDRGRTGLFLSNYQWNDTTGRSETPNEFTHRLSIDYKLSIERLNENVPDIKVTGIALPYSEAGQEYYGNANSALNVNEHLLEKYFRFAFIQDVDGYNRISSPSDDDGMLVLRRFSVPQEWTSDLLMSHLARKNPMKKANMQLAKIAYRQGQFAEAKESFEDDSEDPSAQYYLASMDYQQNQFPEARARLSWFETQQIDPALRSRVDKFSRKLTWHTNPTFEARYVYQEDSNDDGHSEFAAKGEYPIHERAHVWLEPGVIDLHGTTDASRTASMISSGVRVNLPSSLSFDGSFRYRNFDEGDDTYNYSLWSQYQYGRTSLLLRWSQRDIDTLRAKLAEIDASRIDVGLSTRFLERWSSSANASYVDYSDDVQRTDVRLDVRYNFRELRSVSIGPDVVYRDANKPSPSYYAPDELIAGRLNVFFNKQIIDALMLRSKAGFGLAHDKTSGSRLSSDILFQLNMDITDSAKGLLGVTYSRVPNYDNLILNASFNYLF